jgi:hypothetical protein
MPSFAGFAMVATLLLLSDDDDEKLDEMKDSFSLNFF